MTAKQCRECMQHYPQDHWAYGRERCPACGGALVAQTAGQMELEYEHYDSSADIRFDLSGLLSPERKHETKLVLWAGLGLLLLAFAARFGFVTIGRLEGFWAVPWWFDAIVGAMLLLAAVMVVWAARRLIRHRRALRRGG